MNSGDIHDKFCQGENGDFPLTFRIEGIPEVLNVNLPQSDLFNPLWSAFIDQMRPDIHLLYQGRTGLRYTISLMTSTED